MATIFSGSSRYAADFQSLIERAVAIKSLPLQQKQSQLATLQSQSSELNTLNGSFSALRAAIAGLGSALGTDSFTASVGDSDVASAAVSGTPMAGTYSIEVVSMGTFAAAMSSDGLTAVGDPAEASLSDATSFTLKVGSAEYAISPTDATLTALAEAINLKTGAGVQATLVNIGSAASPDYRLSLQSTKLGNLPVQLTAIDGTNPSQNLMTAQTAGSPATYRVNGKPAQPVESDTRVLTVSPGVVVTLKGVGTTDVTVGRSVLAVSSALGRFTNAYNAAQAAINRHRGEDAGALQGQSLLSSLTTALHRLSEYTDASSGIGSLASLGLTFDKEGVLSFDTAVFSTATAGKLPELTTFLGSGEDGGFLKLATDTMNAITGEETGLLTEALDTIGEQIDRDSQGVAEEQDLIDRLRTQIETRIAAADAAIAAMEQKYNYLSNMFTAMQENSKNYR